MKVPRIVYSTSCEFLRILKYFLKLFHFFLQKSHFFVEIPRNLNICSTLTSLNFHLSSSRLCLNDSNDKQMIRTSLNEKKKALRGDDKVKKGDYHDDHATLIGWWHWTPFEKIKRWVFLTKLRVCFCLRLSRLRTVNIYLKSPPHVMSRAHCPWSFPSRQCDGDLLNKHQVW